MVVGVTGGTGFIGRYIIRQLIQSGHQVVAWYRGNRPPTPIDMEDSITWIPGSLRDANACRQLVDSSEAIVHAALYRPGKTFRGTEGNLVTYVDQNITGSMELMTAAVASRIRRFVFLSSGSVHEQVLSDRPLDECHPTWALSHYGAHKAAIEQFVFSYGLGYGFPICALRPTAVYGLNEPVENSKWFELVGQVVRNEAVVVSRGGKEVHVADVAQAVQALLDADPQHITGQAFECYDQYISEWDVAQLAKSLAGSQSSISGSCPTPAHQIVTDKIRSLGVSFGGQKRLHQTIASLVAAHQST